MDTSKSKQQYFHIPWWSLKELCVLAIFINELLCCCRHPHQLRGDKCDCIRHCLQSGRLQQNIHESHRQLGQVGTCWAGGTCRPDLWRQQGRWMHRHGGSLYRMQWICIRIPRGGQMHCLFLALFGIVIVRYDLSCISLYLCSTFFVSEFRYKCEESWGI